MKKILLLSSTITVLSIALFSSLNTTNASASLPPNATSGAPADAGGATCTSCHAGTATQTTGVISSDIPGSGYVGGTIYNFTVSMAGAAAYGFELTPQTATSNVGLGTWIAGTGTSVSGKYIKQSAKKTGAAATWTFQWTAPATATTVTFYGSFNYANNNGGDTGDAIKKSSITYVANTSGVNENNNTIAVSIFPNPTSEILHVASTETFSQGMIYSLEGKLVKTISEQELLSKTISVSELPSSVYFINISSDNGKTYTSKFIKK